MRRKSKKAGVRAVPVPPPAVVSTPTRWLCTAGVFLLLFAIYVLTLIPTVVDQDSGELVSVAHVLGIAHPTGYPLWALLARGFDWLPLGGTSAHRIALLSAVSTAGAAALLCWLTISLTGTPLAGLFAGLCFGLWLPAWSQATLAEVYAFEGLLFALFLFALWWWDRTPTSRRLYWLALAGGAAVMHHRTGLLALGPALAVAIWLTRPRRARLWLAGGAAFLVPFLCYIYLPLRAAAHSPMNWGDPSTFDRFLAHAGGSEYARLAFANSVETAAQQALVLFKDALAGPGWPSAAVALLGVPLLLWGALTWGRRRPALVISLLLGSAFLAIWVVFYGVTNDSAVWLIPIGAVLAVLGGFGLARVSAWRAPRTVGPCLAAGLGAALCALLLSANWSRADESNNWQHRDRWEAMLEQMDRNAILVVESDNPINAAHYLQQVEGRRRDVVLIEPTALWADWYAPGLPDPALGRFAQQAWREITAQRDVHWSSGNECWQCATLLAVRLAQRYRGQRTVYALHGPMTEALTAPPYFVALSRDLIRLDFAPPDVPPMSETRRPLAEFSNGTALVSLTFDRKEASAGELVGFRARWQFPSVLNGWAFRLKLVPASGPAAAQWRRVQDKGCFAQTFLPVYGLWGLSPPPPGQAYEQQGRLMIPSNSPPGRYGLEVEVSESASGSTQSARLDAVDLLVHPRALPSNGPRS